MSDLAPWGAERQNQRALFVGLPVELGAWLDRRLPGVVVTCGQATDATLDDLKTGRYSLLVIDYKPTAVGDSGALDWVRVATTLTPAPLLFCLDQGAASSLVYRIVGEFAAAEFLYHPIDREELAHRVAITLGIPEPPIRAPVDSVSPDLRAAVAAVWDQYKGQMINGLDVIDQTFEALVEGRLTDEMRREAVIEAHKLSGTVGTAGLTEGSRQARELEHLLTRALTISQSQIQHLGRLSRSLRRELVQESVLSPNAGSYADEGRSNQIAHLLIVDDDRVLSKQLAAEAIARGMGAEIATDVASAREELLRRRPDVVLLDLLFPTGMAESLTLLTDLSNQEPPVPVLVLTGRDTFTDRVDVARLGGAGFLQKPVPPAQVLDAVSQLLHRLSTSEVKVLAVDDDPQILATLRVLLAKQTIHVTTLADPLRFWETLEETAPDLLILDVDMPHLSGIELCRVVRNDPRWAAIPVVFLTAHTDGAMIHRIFAAGGDDYVTKPIIGPELVTRIDNRLERTQLHRSAAETDALTGLPNRRKANLLISQYFRLAARNNEHLCLAVVDVDQFKQINDRYGHLAGDTVLSRLGRLMLHAFRSDDVVARWGGEEFLVAMYGTTRQNGIHRLADILDIVRHEEFGGDDGVTFNVTFSGGVAVYPEDEQSLQLLFREADDALYRAKESGRNRLAAAKRPSGMEVGVNVPDILFIEGDAPSAGPVIEALETRAYDVRWVPDLAAALEVLATLGPDSLVSIIILHQKDLRPDELSKLSQLAGEEIRRFRTLLLLDPSAGLDAAFPTPLNFIRRVPQPFTLQTLMQQVRRSLEN